MAQRTATQPRLKSGGWLSCLFGLAPCGVYRAVAIAAHAVGSYPTLSPLPGDCLQKPRPLARKGIQSRPAVCFLLHWPSLNLDAEVPDVIRHTALWSSDFPLPLECAAEACSERQRPSGRLHRCSVPSRSDFGPTRANIVLCPLPCSPNAEAFSHAPPKPQRLPCCNVTAGRSAARRACRRVLLPKTARPKLIRPRMIRVRPAFPARLRFHRKPLPCAKQRPAATSLSGLRWPLSLSARIRSMPRSFGSRPTSLLLKTR